MLPKWVYPLLITFVVFFILSSPEAAGPQARTFFSWVGDQASSAATFLDGLFGDDAVGPSDTPATSVPPGGEDDFTTMPRLVLLDPLPA